MAAAAPLHQKSHQLGHRRRSNDLGSHVRTDDTGSYAHTDDTGSCVRRAGLPVAGGRDDLTRAIQDRVFPRAAAN